MFGVIFSAIGGIFSGIGNAVRGYFLKRGIEEAVDGISKNVEKVIPVVERAVDTAGDVAQAAGTVSTSAATAVSSLADVAKSDNQAAIELHQEMTNVNSSWLSRNVRPLIALVSFILLIAGEFHYVPYMEWASGVVFGYMGLRSFDKLGQLISTGSVIKNLLSKK